MKTGVYTWDHKLGPANYRRLSKGLQKYILNRKDAGLTLNEIRESCCNAAPALPTALLNGN
jgi:hypothetical protein